VSPLRQAQGGLFGGLGANGGGANPGVLKWICRDMPMGRRAEGEVDRCPPFAADVSTFRANVSSFGADVSTFGPDVSSLRADVFSLHSQCVQFSGQCVHFLPRCVHFSG